jgi:hypothetical protein
MLNRNIVFVPNYINKPPLAANDEEYSMLVEVSEEFEKQKTDKTIREKHGDPAEIVIRNHLAKRGINLSTFPKVTVQGSRIEIDLLILKAGVDPNQKTYSSDQVKMIIAIENSGAGVKTLQNGKQQNPNKTLRLKFNELQATTNVKNFAVVVLSETLLPPKGPYKWRFKEDIIGKANCKVFTLVARQLYPPGGLYIKVNIAEMLAKKQLRKTDEFQKLINYLKCL